MATIKWPHESFGRHSLTAAVLYIVLFTYKTVESSDNLNCTSQRFDATIKWNATIHGQKELDSFFDNLTSFSNGSTDRCIQLILTGHSYKLDVIKLMKIKLGTADGLTIFGHNVDNPRVKINCVSEESGLEELRSLLKPLSNVSLVVLKGLTFIGCPVPVVLEEVSTVIVQNCNFM